MKSPNFEEYLKEHGISESTAQKFGIQFDEKNLKIIIPIKDIEGNFLFNKYRHLLHEENPEVPKFTYDRGASATLYNLEALKNSKYAFIFEGEFDAIKASQDDIPAVSNTSGTGTFNKKWAEQFIGKNVLICYDTDQAGKGGAKKVQEFIPEALIIKLPDGAKDYCEYRQKYSIADFQKLVSDVIKVNTLLPHKEVTPQSSLNSQIKREKIKWPDPISDNAFYGLASEVIHTIEPHSEADPVALLANFLTGIGSIIGDKPHFSVEADKHPTRLFINLVGKTSKGRKGTSWGYIRRILAAIDSNWDKKIQTGLSSGEGLIWAVRDEITQHQPIKKGGQVVGYQQVIIDPGVKDKRILVIESEFASTLRVLGRDGNTLSPVIRNAWDSGSLQTLTKNSPAKATGAHISIIGHISLQELLRYLTEVETANGFGNRFLWFCVQRSKSLPFGSKFDELELAPLISKLKEVLEFAEEINQVNWADETKPIWGEVYPKLSEGLPGLAGSMLARAEAYVVRLAVLYALLDKSILIRPQHLKAALAIWKYCEDSVRYIFQDRTGDPLADEIWDELSQNPEGMSRTDISDSLSRHKSAQQIEDALNLLKLLAHAKSKIISTEGRDKEIWFTTNTNGEKSEVSEGVGLVNSLNSQQTTDENSLKEAEQLNDEKGPLDNIGPLGERNGKIGHE